MQIHIPNILTVLRLLLIAPFIYFLAVGSHQAAFYIFIVAGISDALDGFLARRFNWTTRFGSMLDPIADKLLLMSSFIALGWLSYIPIWLTVIVVLRDVFIMAGVLVLEYLTGPFIFLPSLLSKANTFFQILLVVLIVFRLEFDVVPNGLINVVMLIVLITTSGSFINYAWEWWKRLFLSSKV